MLGCYVVPAAVILSHVFSPQYLLWAIPLLLLLALEILPAARARPWVLGAVLLVVATLSTWLFPYHYFETFTPVALVPADPSGLAASPWAYVVLGVRNFAYLGVIIGMGVMMVRHSDGAG